MSAGNQAQIPHGSEIIKWAATQPFTNLLLILILGAIAWVSHHVLTVSVPSHLQQIQDGYERIEEAHREERATIIKQYDKWFEYIQRRADTTGHVAPENIIQELWNQKHEPSSEVSSVVGARGISNEASDTATEQHQKASFVSITTPGGTVVTWYDIADSGGNTGLQTSGARIVGRSQTQSRRSSSEFEMGVQELSGLSQSIKPGHCF